MKIIFPIWRFAYRIDQVASTLEDLILIDEHIQHGLESVHIANLFFRLLSAFM